MLVWCLSGLENKLLSLNERKSVVDWLMTHGYTIHELDV